MPELLGEFSIAQATGTFRKTVEAYQKADFLILDERRVFMRKRYDLNLPSEKEVMANA